MVPQPLDLLNRFFANILLEGDAPRNDVSTKHKLLADHDAQFIADIVKVVGLVVTATPFSDHVHMGVASRLKNLAVNIRRHAVRKAVERNDVRTFGINRDAIDYELETLAPLVGDAVQFHRTQSSLHIATCHFNFLPYSDRGREMITNLSAVAHGIPQLWRGDAKRK